MITKEQAFNIANQIVPGLEQKIIRISDDLSNSLKLKVLPENCWYVSYSPVQVNYSSCVSGYHNYLK